MIARAYSLHISDFAVLEDHFHTFIDVDFLLPQVHDLLRFA
jgi:hypothetical protein